MDGHLFVKLLRKIGRTILEALSISIVVAINDATTKLRVGLSRNDASRKFAMCKKTFLEKTVPIKGNAGPKERGPHDNNEQTLGFVRAGGNQSPDAERQ